VRLTCLGAFGRSSVRASRFGRPWCKLRAVDFRSNSRVSSLGCPGERATCAVNEGTDGREVRDIQRLDADTEGSPPAGGWSEAARVATYPRERFSSCAGVLSPPLPRSPSLRSPGASQGHSGLSSHRQPSASLRGHRAPGARAPRGPPPTTRLAERGWVVAVRRLTRQSFLRHCRARPRNHAVVLALPNQNRRGTQRERFSPPLLR
jgi:hypothetical protein